MDNTSLSVADEARNYALLNYILPARKAGRDSVTIRAGDIHRELGWHNRMPSVCSAIQSMKFRRLAKVDLIERTGPEKSTTVEWTFSLNDSDEAGEQPMERVAAVTRTLVADWDGQIFRPVVVPEELAVGSQVILTVQPIQDPREAAGRFAKFVGTLSAEEAAEMTAVMDEAFETISNEW